MGRKNDGVRRGGGDRALISLWLPVFVLRLALWFLALFYLFLLGPETSQLMSERVSKPESKQAGDQASERVSEQP